MAFFDNSYSKHAAPDRFGSLRRLLDTPFDARARRIRRRIAELRALSDEDLAACGVQRDGIVRHVILTSRR